ncbi:exo-alpha-sialidase [Pirellulales bacterium]|nr:exo-alpha-sialidase [Pirellulales bacterium]
MRAPNLLLVALVTLIAFPAMTGEAKEFPAPMEKEWLRSDPDVVVYLPRGGEHNDGDNEHFLVFPAPKSEELLAMWTQSSVEDHGDNHIVLARSSDAENWSEPQWIYGTHKGTSEPQASWGFPVVSRRGRIYCFYSSAPQGAEAGVSGVLGAHISDDNGHTWTKGAETIVRTTLEDPADLDSEETEFFIVWQKPIRDRHGRVLAGYTQWTKDWVGSIYFMRFDNIDEGPDPADLKITWLPDDGKAIRLPRYVQPTGCEEPSIVLLPDGRLFTTMRTTTGYIWYSVSDDDGHHWRDAEVLRYRDNGQPIKQPHASCPIYPLRDGRFLLVYHNNDYYARNKLYGEALPENHPNIPIGPIYCYRRPAHIAVGEFRPRAHQPIWFSEPKQILDTDGMPVGPKRTDEIATYPSITDFKGKQVLWYPDRKHFLLGKFVDDKMLSGLTVGE